ncbi:hypothetical protein [Sphingomonas sp.]|uniref:hypothetical protein n=1 Tax=Sphingomonas sp. TaxID=28214 RepID=UPI00257946A4|nr:hypothetical protein [Sphingomonas sp.]
MSNVDPEFLQPQHAGPPAGKGLSASSLVGIVGRKMFSRPAFDDQAASPTIAGSRSPKHHWFAACRGGHG